MAVYFVTGKLGSGKTLCTVGKIKEYLEQGRRVATNLDLNLMNLLPETSKQSVVRLPDKPRVDDMQLLGDGCLESDESKYGLIVLDELGTWFNSRNWRDKERLSLIDWFLHARKYHWDIFFIVQSLDSLDGQLINSLCEHLVVCKRTDRLSLPVIGSLIRFLGFQSIFPKIHIAKVYYGSSESSISVARWWYRGKDLYNCYKTDQKFSDDQQIVNVPSVDKKGHVLLDESGHVIYENDFMDMRSTYTVLAPYYQNAIQYRNILVDQLSTLSGKKNDAKNTRPTDGGFYQHFILPQKTIIFTCLIFMLFSFYGLSRDIDEIQVIPTAHASILPVLPSLPVEKKEPIQKTVEIQYPELDHFQAAIKGSIIKFESFVSDGHNYYANLRIKNKENTQLISLDELRLNGYWLTKEGKYITIHKDTFNIRIKL